MAKKILFVGQEAFRTGAPILFLNFLKWFKREADLPFRILLRGGGELEPEFRALAPLQFFGQQPASKNIRRLRAAVQRAGLSSMLADYDRAALKGRYRQGEIGLVYTNGGTEGEILERLSYLKSPVVSHIDGLNYDLTHHDGGASFDLLKRNTGYYIAGSEAVRRDLIEKHSIPQDRIDMVYEFIDVKSCSIADAAGARKRVRTELGIPLNSLVVGMAGTVEWRKGPDIFIQIASMVNRSRPNRPMYFVWVGGPIYGSSLNEPMLDVEKAGLKPVVRFVGAKPNPMDYFSIFDIFALTSRSEAFGIVILEAATLGIPTVCFERAGGPQEFVEADCGFVVPYLDVAAFAERIGELLESPELRARMGETARKKVLERHDISVSAPRIRDVIKRFYVG
jgi:glycosyltransferase involved in cell wall biosynthesis